MNTIYIHIGYPKCFSTTLQRSYFEKHPAIHFGGVGIGDNISYDGPDIELTFESLLKYANEFFWDKYKKKVKKSIHDFIRRAGKKKVVFSSEHLSMNFSLQGIDNKLKYERIKYLFDDFEIRLLIIKRDPIRLIKSLYGEYVKMGYSEEYKYFLKWIITFQDRNFLVDLNYQKKGEQLKQIFGKDNITWLTFEEIKKIGVEKSLNQELSNWLGIDYQFIPIENNNPSLTDKEISSLVKWNKQHPRGLGKAQTEPFERHRSRILFKKADLDFSEEEIFSEVIKKREAIVAIKENPVGAKEDFKKLAKLEQKVLSIIDSYS